MSVAESQPSSLPPGHVASLVSAAANGDRRAWEEIVDAYASVVWHSARRHLSESDAAHVCETVWLRLLENIDRVGDPDHLGEWLTTTTRGECLRFLAVAHWDVDVPVSDLGFATCEPGDETLAQSPACQMDTG